MKEEKEEIGEAEIRIADLPACPVRRGGFLDHEPVLSCGFRVVEPSECLSCGGFWTVVDQC